MSPAPAAVLALVEMMRAVNAGDASAYARLYAPEAVIAMIGGDALRGRPAIEAYEVGLLREFPGTRLQFYDAWLSGPSAVVHYGVNGRTSAGQSMGHEGLLFYRFEPSGLISEERRYLDSLTPMAQIGALGARPARALPSLLDRMATHLAEGTPEEAANVALVKASLSALGSGHEAAFFSTVAERATFDELMLREPFSGAAGARDWFAVWSAAMPGAITTITRIEGVEDWVLAETLLRGRLRGPLGPLSPSDRELEVHRALVVQVKDRKIARLLSFMNGKELAQATRQWPLPARERSR